MSLKLIRRRSEFHKCVGSCESIHRIDDRSGSVELEKQQCIFRIDVHSAASYTQLQNWPDNEDERLASPEQRLVPALSKLEQTKKLEQVTRRNHLCDTLIEDPFGCNIRIKRVLRKTRISIDVKKL